MTKLNSNDKICIRTIVLNIREYKANDTIAIKRINTGSNIYTVRCNYSFTGGIKYSVLKDNKSGKFIGEAHILRISEHGLDYSNQELDAKLPDSVLTYIKVFNNYINKFMQYGEQAFNM